LLAHSCRRMAVRGSCSRSAQLRNTDISQHLSLPPVKLHCRWDARKNALRMLLTVLFAAVQYAGGRRREGGGQGLAGSVCRGLTLED
jgi:hypothetical protein